MNYAAFKSVVSIVIRRVAFHIKRKELPEEPAHMYRDALEAALRSRLDPKITAKIVANCLLNYAATSSDPPELRKFVVKTVQELDAAAVQSLKEKYGS